uniref:[heparan sulfate]-glucosamine N-sulfotransferase n=1 Tax=Arion vulgaris TaxID=1028688 RepID=A0A0B7BT56_9EUPU
MDKHTCGLTTKTKMFVIIISGKESLHNSLKKFSFRKVMSIIGVTFLTWSAFWIAISPEIRHHLRATCSNTSLDLSQRTDAIEHVFDANDWTSNSNDYFYDNVIEDNPLGLYFSDRLDEKIPVGRSHLKFYKREHMMPLKMVLIFVQDVSSFSANMLEHFFAQQRIEYRLHNFSTYFPSLVIEDIGLPRYSLFVFEDYVTYLSMEFKQRTILDRYCRRYQVGILALTQSTRSEESDIFSNMKLILQHRMELQTFKLNQDSKIWRVAKPQEVYTEALPTSDWTIFIHDHDTYTPLVYSTIKSDWRGSNEDVSSTEFGCTVAVHDQGLQDGIQRVIIGYDIDFWLNSLVAMDAITHLTNGRLGLPLTRLLQIDVDDMFVGITGTRTLVKDAMHMVESQERIRQIIPEFTYKLGFSGGHYLKGSGDEQNGDRKVIALAQHFDWFSHMYKHEATQNLSRIKLKTSLDNNDQFAKKKNLPQVFDYMVTPFHSGVYPVYDVLYDEWNERGVLSTSTSCYPHPKPTWNRRGFIYRGIMVLPRQYCDLSTTTIRFENYIGGKSGLDNSIHGQRLFKMFLYTPVIMVMTHMSNYANDRLAEYTFENVVKFVNKWTNLNMVAPPPMEIAGRYFEMYPNEVIPIWTNPCQVDTGRNIVPPHVSCTKFPKLIIVGPNQIGSTVLQNFIQAHPLLVSKIGDPIQSNEFQFFHGDKYLLGLDWYQKHFPEPETENVMLFETNANYFDSEMVPKRVHALIPDAKIVIILADPIKRAYMWYQHLRFRMDPAAINYTFYQFVSASNKAPFFLRKARSRCLKSSAYVIHLARWLQYFPVNQIYLVDGDELKDDPVSVVNKLQTFLNLQPFIDFSKKLRYDPLKKFFCRIDNGCLGMTIGRDYPPMDEDSIRYLDSYFADHNTNLKTVLNHIGREHPRWLTETPSI